MARKRRQVFYEIVEEPDALTPGKNVLFRDNSLTRLRRDLGRADSITHYKPVIRKVTVELVSMRSTRKRS